MKSSDDSLSVYPSRIDSGSGSTAGSRQTVIKSFRRAGHWQAPRRPSGALFRASS